MNIKLQFHYYQGSTTISTSDSIQIFTYIELIINFNYLLVEGFQLISKTYKISSFVVVVDCFIINKYAMLKELTIEMLKTENNSIVQ